MKLALCLALLVFFLFKSVENSDEDSDVVIKEACVFHECSCDSNDSENEIYIGCFNISDTTSLLTRNNEYSIEGSYELLIQYSESLIEVPSMDLAGIAIKSIIISNNNLKKISLNAFNGVIGLKLLDLSHNCLGCGMNQTKVFDEDEAQSTPLLDPTVFAQLSSIEELNLKHNRLGLFNETDLNRLFPRSLRNLKHLNLQSNDLSKVPRIDATSIEVLNLEKNLILEIEMLSFGNLSRLQYLNLRNNLISFIADGAFQSMKNLETLDMAQNEIKTFSNGLLIGLGRLSNLDLSRQRLSDQFTVTDLMFDRALVETEKFGESIKLSVSLANNKINEISELAFCALTNPLKSTFIKEVDLSGSAFTVVDACVFRPLNTRKVERNSYSLTLPNVKCDCHVTYLSSVFDLKDSMCENQRQELVPMMNFECIGYNESKIIEECDRRQLKCPLVTTVNYSIGLVASLHFVFLCLSLSFVI